MCKAQTDVASWLRTDRCGEEEGEEEEGEERGRRGRGVQREGRQRERGEVEGRWWEGASWLRTDRCGEEEEEGEGREVQREGRGQGRQRERGEVEGRWWEGERGVPGFQADASQRGNGTTDWDIEDSRPEREVHVVPDRGV